MEEICVYPIHTLFMFTHFSIEQNRK
jgi:hypothetical protein